MVSLVKIGAETLDESFVAVKIVLIANVKELARFLKPFSVSLCCFYQDILAESVPISFSPCSFRHFHLHNLK